MNYGKSTVDVAVGQPSRQQRVMVNLKFPNVRLHLQNLVVKNNLTGAEAIARTAFDFGLIGQEAASEVIASQDGSQCMTASRAVLKKYFETKEPLHNLEQTELDIVWQAVERGLEHIQPPTHDCQGRGRSSNCQKVAPLVFDLMLQQIHRYP